MNNVKELVFSLCLVCVMAGLFRMILPSGGMQRVCAMVMGLFTLVCFFTPFTKNMNLESLLDFSLEDLKPFQGFWEENQQTLEKAVVDEVTKTVEHLGEQHGVEVQVTQVQTQVYNSEYNVGRVVLVINGTKEQAKKLEQELLKTIECEVLVSWTKES